MLEYGLRYGLAQSGQWDQKINDLRQNELLNQQAKLLAEKKAQLFADDFDYNNAMNAHDNPLVKQFSQAKIREIGSFINQNPDWETDPGKRAQYKQMVHDLKDNPDLNRGLQSDANYQLLTKSLAEKSKNPDLFDADAYNEELNAWKRYEKFGNRDAYSEQDAKRLGKKAFIFQQPHDWSDLPKVGLEYGNKFKDFEIKPMKGGFIGSYEQIPKQSSLNALASDFYSNHKRQMDLRYQQAGYNSPLEYAKGLIMAGINPKFDMGDASASLGFAKMRQEGSAKPMTQSTWKKSIGDTDEGLVNGDNFKKAIGAKPPIVVKNDDGTQAIDFTGKEVDYSGYHKYIGDDKKNGQKHFQVQLKLTPEEAEQKGILDTHWLASDEISPGWRGKASVEKMTDREGKERKYVIITDMVKFPVNEPSYAGIFDQSVQTAKNVPGPQDEYQTKVNVGKDEAGNLWVLDENGKPVAPYKK